MNAAVCTLFEGHYHLGAAALINSLHVSGFDGKVICGYRGELPPWASRPSTPGEKIHIHRVEGIEVIFVRLETDIHFTNYKPSFLLSVWETHALGAGKLFYFDPDIVVKCPWAIVDLWAEKGIALCEDVNCYLPRRHPLRLRWLSWLKDQDLAPAPHDHDRYYSGGFIGVPISEKGFLSIWENLITRVTNTIGSDKQLKQGDPTSLFHSTDQDALNIALMCSNSPVNGAGPEVMDFTPGGHLLSHAIGPYKPWRGEFIRQALRGYPPSAAVKSFFLFSEKPISIFSPVKKTSLQLSLKIAALVGRFYRRS